MDKFNLNSFLILGYNLDFINSKYSFNLSGVNKDTYRDSSEKELIKIGSEKLLRAIENYFTQDSSNVVPISGGLDSRAILAGLMEFTSSEKIKTYTFGTPGTLDYEIGNKIATVFGTNHRKIPLTEHIFTTDELIKVSKRTHHQTVLFHNPPLDILDNYCSGHSVWSGFMGDPIAGSHFSELILEDVNEEKIRFINTNRFVKSIDLIDEDIKELFELIKVPNLSIKDITLKEQIDFENRQLKYVAPYVLMEEFDYKLPFLDKEWIDFMLSIDNKFRKDEYLYKKILLKAFPKAFSYETKTNYGYPINKKLNNIHVNSIRIQNKIRRIINSKRSIFTDPNINYLDFNNGIREREDLYNVVRNNVMDLKKRKILSDKTIDKVWLNHINKKSNHSDALLVLASLEIHLKVLDGSVK